MRISFLLLFVISIALSASCEKEDKEPSVNGEMMQLVTVKAGAKELSVNEDNTNVPVDKTIAITFNKSIEITTLKDNLKLIEVDSSNIPFDYTLLSDKKTISLKTSNDLSFYTDYILSIKNGVKSEEGHSFPGAEFHFKTVKGEIKLESVTINNKDFSEGANLKDIDFNIEIIADFNVVPDLSTAESQITLTGNGSQIPLSINLSEDDSSIVIRNDSELNYYKNYKFTIPEKIVSSDSVVFSGFSNSFYTRLDSTNKLPVISDEELLTKIQQQTFKYFWDFGHPVSGLARERNTSGDIVTTGGSGFGIMSIIVGIERGFITRQEGIDRLSKILDFLENDADRFHGAWPHWLDGTTGDVKPFGDKDDGGDLVETAFLIQGLIAFREYLDPGTTQEDSLINQINRLWEGVEWDWYTQGEDVLYWHWSPNYGFEKDLQVKGYNETLMTYILAASSPTYSISDTAYHEGFAQNGAMVNGNQYYGYALPLGQAYGGPLFFEHYSFLGLDPRNLQDQYASYWEQAVNHTLINRAYCIDNPNSYIGYDKNSWGLTASDNYEGYSAHSPTNDLGVITPTAAISSIPYTPEKSMNAIHRFYYKLGDRLWGEYGFYDAFSPENDWYADSYIAIDQGPIIIMIENYRSGLLWQLFMSAPEVQNGLDKLGFTY